MTNGLLILLTIIPGVASAQPILFRSVDAPETEYRARLKSDEALRSPVRAYLDQHPLPRVREQLIVRFARAQRAFLDGEIGEARQYFLETVALVPADDWLVEQREVFLNAYLRLAQLEHDESARERWLVEAQYLGERLKFDEDLFPPPVTKRYRGLAHQLPRVRPAIESSGWPLLLINGVHCTPASCPTVPAPSHTVRVTFLSDQWITQTQQVDVAQLNRLRPPRFAWVNGGCGKSDLSVAARTLGDGRAFQGFACEAPRLAPAYASVPAAPVVNVAQRPISSIPPVHRPFYRSPWLWAGVGAAIVAGVALALRPAHHRESEPTAPPPGPQPSTIYGY